MVILLYVDFELSFVFINLLVIFVEDLLLGMGELVMNLIEVDIDWEEIVEGGVVEVGEVDFLLEGLILINIFFFDEDDLFERIELFLKFDLEFILMLNFVDLFNLLDVYYDLIDEEFLWCVLVVLMG